MMNKDPKSLPPMLRSYLSYKERYPDTLVFMQVGDFYELFFEDAEVAARTLNLTLTSRDKNSDDPVPMCGVPLSVVDGYVDRIVDSGYSVAVVSQVGDTNAKKGMVERTLERIVTPGVRTLSGAESESSGELIGSVSLSPEKTFSFACLLPEKGEIGLREELQLDALISEVGRVSPKELIIPNRQWGHRIDRRVAWVRRLERVFGGQMIFKFRTPKTGTETCSGRILSGITGLNLLSAASKDAAVLLVDYLDEVTVGGRLEINTVSVRNDSSFVSLDYSTRENLELVRNLKGRQEQGTLFGTVDRTLTAGGRRKLKAWILNPLTDLKEIERRLDAVSFFKENSLLREKVRDLLRGISDVERIAARIELEAAAPRELGGLLDSLEIMEKTEKVISDGRLHAGIKDAFKSPLVAEAVDSLTVPEKLLNELRDKLVDSPPPGIKSGGIFKGGVSEELDHLREIKSKGRSWIAELESAEKALTGINSLKIKFNNVLGYFIEVTKANLDRVPERYILRQTTVAAKRYATEELKNREEEILNAESKLTALESRLFEEFRRSLKTYSRRIKSIGEAASQIDVLAGLAEYAAGEDLVRPVVDTSLDIEIENGRHPVLCSLMRSGFISNSLELGSEKGRFAVLTGPNMGGKSTYLKQNALIVLMAQMGFFVPAKKARIGVIDRLFTRIGASDNMLEGESTFMLEMKEASSIISGATERSLLLIDELGRGTATTDGLSLAYAVSEWIINKIKARTLFATHFHPLTGLASAYRSVQNLSVGSLERGGEVYFTYEIKQRAADKSYGLEVARMAGLPEKIIARARELLGRMEEAELEELELKPETAESPQLSIFEGTADKPERRDQRDVAAENTAFAEIKEKLNALVIEETTPLEALNVLSVLREILNKRQNPGVK